MTGTDTGWRNSLEVSKKRTHIDQYYFCRSNTYCQYLGTNHRFHYGIVFVVIAHMMLQVGAQELFSATDSLEQLVNTERSLVRRLEGYLRHEEERIHKLRSYVSNYYRTAPDDADSAAQNPLHAYLMLKRMTEEWREVEDILAETNECMMFNSTRHYIGLSTSKARMADVKGAALAVVRLQDVYNLSIPDLLEGRFAGFNAATPLSAQDCILFANEAIMSANLESAEKWLLHCRNLSSVDHRIRTCNDMNRRSGHSIKNNVEERLRHVENLKTLFDTQLSGEKDIISLSSIPDISQDMLSFLRDEYKDAEVKKNLTEVYKKLCQGERLRPEWLDSDLHCHYHRGFRRWYRLQPIKIEYLSYEPVVVIFHDVLSDKDIEYLQLLAKPQLKVSLVHKGREQNGTVSSARVGKMAWLPERPHKVVQKLYRAVGSMTGLSTRSAEDLQVLNYGVGGHYEAHTDFFDFHAKDAIGPGGDRIATVLFYLSDVQAGGATVFPSLALSISPNKGSALFWYNLHKNGKGDYRTVHAACPVMIGSKWVANLWLHDLGQEFLRPCSRDQNE